ncbi:MAG: hypothetical protein ABJN26_11425 [Stappiaceae bacterium]
MIRVRATIVAILGSVLLALPSSAATVKSDGPVVDTGTDRDGITAPIDLDSPSEGGGKNAPKETDSVLSEQADETLPEILYTFENLPTPVRRMREQILEAAQSGKPEKLRPVLEANEVPPTLAFDEVADPIDYLKTSSGDGEGLELLAILSEVLEAGFVHVDKGTAQEMYVWPYFARYPLHGLKPDQMVELYRLVTAGDYADMQNFGAYSFYRVGIGPDGTWHYFVAGD